MTNRAGVLAVVVLLAASAIPAALAAWAATADESVPDLAAAPIGLSAPAEPVRFEERAPVIARPSRSAGATIALPPWTGTVTAVSVTPGSTVAEGDELVEVDGIRRIVHGGDKPFYRELRLGDRGTDVAALQRFLVRLGYLDAEPDGAFGPATRAAVRDLGTDLGLPRPPDAFSPAWVVWIPQPFAVADVPVRPGLHLPGELPHLLAGPASLESVILAPALNDAVLDLEPGTDWVLEVEGVVVDIDPKTLAVTPAGVARLAAAGLRSDEDLAGFVRRRTPIDGHAVPAPSVVDGTEGLCVWARDAGDAAWRTVTVDLLEGGLGRTLVAGPLAELTVLANPGEMGFTACG